MDKKIEKLPESKAKITITLKKEEFLPYLDMASSELSTKIDIPGFRPGKAPRKMVEEKIGKEKIAEEAINTALNKIFPKIVAEEKLNILGQPQAKIDFPRVQQKGELFAEIEVVLLPEVILPDFKKIAKEEEKKPIKIEEKEIEDALLWLQKSRAKLSKKLSPAIKGDQAEINYEIRNNGILVENGQVKNQKIIIGENKLLPDFEKNLIGSKEGEEKSFSLKCPADFWKKELKGKMLDFKVKINSVFKVELPEISDEFAKSIGDFSDLKKLKENIKKGIEMEKGEAEKRRWQDVVLLKIAKEAKINVPDILIREQKEQMLENMKKTTEEQTGASFEEHLLRLKKTKEDLEKELLPEAEKRVRTFLCVYEIAKKEKIEAKDQEVEREMEQIKSQYPQMLGNFQHSQNQEGFKSFLKEKIVEKKVVNLLYELRDQG